MNFTDGKIVVRIKSASNIFPSSIIPPSLHILINVGHQKVKTSTVYPSIKKSEPTSSPTLANTGKLRSVSAGASKLIKKRTGRSKTETVHNSYEWNEEFAFQASPNNPSVSFSAIACSIHQEELVSYCSVNLRKFKKQTEPEHLKLRFHPKNNPKTTCGFLSIDIQYFVYTFVKPPASHSSLDLIFRNRLALKYFQLFMEQEYSEENYLFFFDVERYKRCCETFYKNSILKNSSKKGHQLPAQVAQEIYHEYISTKSTRQVNLDAIPKENLANKIQELVASGKRFPKDLFDICQKQIYLLMENDTFHRFQRSGLFAEMLETERWIRGLTGLPTSIRKEIVFQLASKSQGQNPVLVSTLRSDSQVSKSSTNPSQSQINVSNALSSPGMDRKQTLFDLFQQSIPPLVSSSTSSKSTQSPIKTKALMKKSAISISSSNQDFATLDEGSDDEIEFDDYVVSPRSNSTPSPTPNPIDVIAFGNHQLGLFGATTPTSGQFNTTNTVRFSPAKFAQVTQEYKHALNAEASFREFLEVEEALVRRSSLVSIDSQTKKIERNYSQINQLVDSLFSNDEEFVPVTEASDIDHMILSDVSRKSTVTTLKSSDQKRIGKLVSPRQTIPSLSTGNLNVAPTNSHKRNLSPRGPSIKRFFGFRSLSGNHDEESDSVVTEASSNTKKPTSPRKPSGMFSGFFSGPDTASDSQKAVSSSNTQSNSSSEPQSPPNPTAPTIIPPQSSTPEASNSVDSSTGSRESFLDMLKASNSVNIDFKDPFEVGTELRKVLTLGDVSYRFGMRTYKNCFYRTNLINHAQTEWLMTEEKANKLGDFLVRYGIIRCCNNSKAHSSNFHFPDSNHYYFCDFEKNQATIFGSPLYWALKPTRKPINGLPRVVWDTATYIRKELADADFSRGVFRVPGSHSRVTELASRYDSGEEFDFSKECPSVMEAASLLKLYIRQLRGGFFPGSLRNVLTSLLSDIATYFPAKSSARNEGGLTVAERIERAHKQLAKQKELAAQGKLDMSDFTQKAVNRKGSNLAIRMKSPTQPSFKQTLQVEKNAPTLSPADTTTTTTTSTSTTSTRPRRPTSPKPVRKGGSKVVSPRKKPHTPHGGSLVKKPDPGKHVHHQKGMEASPMRAFMKSFGPGQFQAITDEQIAAGIPPSIHTPANSQAIKIVSGSHQDIFDNLGTNVPEHGGKSLSDSTDSTDSTKNQSKKPKKSKYQFYLNDFKKRHQKRAEILTKIHHQLHQCSKDSIKFIRTVFALFVDVATHVAMTNMDSTNLGICLATSTSSQTVELFINYFDILFQTNYRAQAISKFKSKYPSSKVFYPLDVYQDRELVLLPGQKYTTTMAELFRKNQESVNTSNSTSFSRNIVDASNY